MARRTRAGALKPSADRIRRLIRETEIGGVRLIDVNAKTRIRSSEEAEDANLMISYGAGLREGPDADGVFFVVAQLKVQVVRGAPKAEPFVSVSAAFELRYRVPEDLRPSRQELDGFAQTNGVFNAWPYFREIVQTVTTRMDLPAIVLPLYRHSLPEGGSLLLGSPRKASLKAGRESAAAKRA